MSLSSPVNTRKLFGKFSDSGDIINNPIGFESCWQFPETMGNGFMKSVNLRPGLMLGIGEFMFKQDLSVAFEHNNLPNDLPIVFRYESHGGWQYVAPNRNFNIKLRSGFTTIGFYPKWEGTAFYPAGHIISSVCLYVSPTLLLEFLQDEDPRFAEEGYEVLADAKRHPLLKAAVTSPAAAQTVTEILNCPFPAPLNRLYLEGKVLELLTHSMSIFMPQKLIESVNHAGETLSLDRLRHARKLLEENLENPPNLPELARAVGLSRSRLHKDFQKAYGITPFGYLHTKRLETARSLLSHGRLNVTEAAYAVGYQNLSHFAKAFKKEFGQSPGRFRKTFLVS